MQIIKKEKGEFGKIKIDFYLNKDREILVTIEQLAQGFGYKNRKGIERMLERNSYLRSDEYSVIAKVPHSLGVPKKHVYLTNGAYLKLVCYPEQKKEKYSGLGYMTI